MAVRKLQVFLSSRFDEFRDVRQALKIRLNGLRVPPVEAVDLDDNAADSRPVLSRCYAQIDRAELFVLLVGSTYGPGLPDYAGKSYTQLEYERALSDRAKTILPFLITQPTSAPDPTDNQQYLREWIGRIRARHTASELDGGRDTDTIANKIFEDILPWLVELFADVDDGDLDESGESVDGGWDGLPISREALAKTRATGDRTSDSPLNLLAANHVREAVVALDAGLRQVAIHHLRHALDLMPLDVVPAYWLARLLVATDRRKKCEEGRRYAVRAAQVALKLGESDDKNRPKAQAMACYIVAGRASERLGDDQAALNYMQTAHDLMDHHWLAKFELGRQFARRRDGEAALALARSAFFLRPDSIRRFQGDAAYHALDEHFKTFYDRLRKQIREEVSAIGNLGPRVRQFAVRVGIEHVAESSSSDSGACGEQADVLDCVRAGRLSARESLELTQLCATKLLAEVNAFTFDGATGVTLETKTRLHDELEAARQRVETVDQQRVQKADELRRCEEARSKLARTVFWGAGISIATAAISRSVGADAIIVLIVVIGILGLWAAWKELTGLNDAHAGLSKEAQQIRTELTEAERTRNRVDDFMTSFAQREASLREQTQAFCDLVNDFEQKCVSRLAFAPAVTLNRQQVGQLARTDFDQALKQNRAVEPDLLPEQLKWLVESSAPEEKHWLSRCIRSGDHKILSRSAAYFQ